MTTEARSTAMFIRCEVAPEAARDTELARKLTEVCPVNIYAVAPDGTCDIVEGNLDECVLCELCVEAAPPGQVKVHKLYSGETLQR
jgi:NAD-dependent dihydropyrimidine dehydrogenase PreA subunit